MACWILMLLGAATALRIPSSISQWQSQPTRNLHRAWSRIDLDYGISSSQLQRLIPVIHKLNAGKPLTAVAIGTSITQEGSAYYPSTADEVVARTKIMPLSLLMAKGPMAPPHHMDGWVSQFMLMVNATWPHRLHTVINYGWPGCYLHCFVDEPCLVKMMPPTDFDLLIIEYIDTFSNGTMIEGVLQRIFESRGWNATQVPAVIIINTPLIVSGEATSKGEVNTNVQCLRAPAKCDTQCAATGPTPFSHYMLGEFFTGDYKGAWLSEHHAHDSAVVGAYYTLPVLSIRHFLAAALRNNVPQAFKQSTCQWLSNIARDGLHPENPAGWQLWAELFFNLLYLTESWMAAHPDYVTAPLPALPRQPLYQHVKGAMSRCFRMPLRGLPGALNVTSLDHKWEWMEYSIGGAKKKYKPGWTSLLPGAEVDILVDTTMAAAPGNQVTVVLAHLTSYEGMGRALIRCTSGCTCQPSEFDGHTTGARVSVIAKHSFTVSKHPQCHFSVTVMQATSSGGYKVKLVALHLRQLA